MLIQYHSEPNISTPVHSEAHDNKEYKLTDSKWKICDQKGQRKYNFQFVIHEGAEI